MVRTTPTPTPTSTPTWKMLTPTLARAVKVLAVAAVLAVKVLAGKALADEPIVARQRYSMKKNCERNFWRGTLPFFDMSVGPSTCVQRILNGIISTSEHPCCGRSTRPHWWTFW
jgi:hypothetical protein